MRLHNFLRHKQPLPCCSSAPKECLHTCFWLNFCPVFFAEKHSAPNNMPAAFSPMVLHVMYMDFFSPNYPFFCGMIEAYTLWTLKL